MALELRKGPCFQKCPVSHTSVMETRVLSFCHKGIPGSGGQVSDHIKAMGRVGGWPRGFPYLCWVVGGDEADPLLPLDVTNVSFSSITCLAPQGGERPSVRVSEERSETQAASAAGNPAAFGPPCSPLAASSGLDLWPLLSAFSLLLSASHPFALPDPAPGTTGWDTQRVCLHGRWGRPNAG
jgi:hypothetical protein